MWQSRVPGALCVYLNTGVIFYWQGAASHPPVVARLRGCQKVCVCVCLFVFPWGASGENIHHLLRPEAFLSESVGGCPVPLRVWGGVCCGLLQGCVQLGPWQVEACRHGGSCCGFVWLFVGGKKGGKSAVWLLVAGVWIWLDRQAPDALIQKM